MRIKTLGSVMARATVVAAGLGMAGLVGPRPLQAQQTANVLVRVNVIRVPMTSAGLDSLGRALLDDATHITRARTEARATRQGLRVLVERVDPRRATGSGTPARGAPRAEPREVVRVEYVAN